MAAHDDDVKKWQNKIFQEIDELEHVEATQMDTRTEDVIMRVADAYGLKKQDVGRLITPGINGSQLHAAMKAAARKKFPKEQNSKNRRDKLV